MTTVSYSATSPYSGTPQTNNYLEYLDIWPGYFAPFRNTDQLITLGAKYVNRPDLLSADLYGTPGYWWIFAVRNPDQIKDPIYDMKAGITIYAPVKNDLPVGGT